MHFKSYIKNWYNKEDIKIAKTTLDFKKFTVAVQIILIKYIYQCSQRYICEDIKNK